MGVLNVSKIQIQKKKLKKIKNEIKLGYRTLNPEELAVG